MPSSQAALGYRARIRGFRFGGWLVNDLEADPLRLNRTQVLARRDPVDYVQVSVLRSGRSLVMQRGRVTVQRQPGDIVVIDPNEPYIFAFERRSRELQIQIPRDHAFELLPRLDDFIAMTISGKTPMGRLAAQSLGAIKSYGDDCADELAYATTNSALRLIDGALRRLEGTDESAHSPEVLLERAKDALRNRLADVDAVSAADIAAEISVSERTLYKLFEGDGCTPQGWLRESRLRAARRMLADPLDRRSIAAIGHSVGFPSAAHFSRTFSARFGASPRAYRAARGDHAD